MTTVKRRNWMERIWKEASKTRNRWLLDDILHFDIGINRSFSGRDKLNSGVSVNVSLEDIKKVSPHFATSSVESYNARALRYTSKDLFYSDKGFEIRTMLSVIDWNMKQRDEIEGRREVLNEKSYFNKTSKRKSLKYLKTRADYSWRKEIVRNAHKIREKEDEAASTEEEIEEKSESEEEAETDDPDSLWDLLEPCSDDEMDKNQESDEESVFE
ncbi:unnamed protein product [Caenorhabditis brenneri]